MFSIGATVLGTLGGIGLIMIAGSFLTLIAYFGVEALTADPDLSDPQAPLVNRMLHVNLDMATWIGTIGTIDVGFRACD